MLCLTLRKTLQSFGLLFLYTEIDNGDKMVHTILRVTRGKVLRTAAMVLFTSVSMSYFSLILLSQSNNTEVLPRSRLLSLTLVKTDPEPLKIRSGPKT